MTDDTERTEPIDPDVDKDEETLADPEPELKEPETEPDDA